MSATARLRHRLPDDLPRGAVTRFAPSPTGLLHLGHAHAALFAAACARAAGGRFLLRLEDIDATRCRPEFAAAILDDLAWLGLSWDGRPREGLASDGVASGGAAREGRARDGVVGDGVAPEDLAHDGVASGGVARDGVVRDGVASEDLARDGVASGGVAWEGRARDGVVGDRLAPEELSRNGPASHGVAREGVARDGMPPDGPVRVQSRHMPEYRAALDRLAARGLLYPCFCTRADIQREVAASGQAPHGPDGPLYPGACRRLSAAGRAARLARGEPHALRLDMAAAMAVAPRDLSFHELGEGHIRCDPAVFGDAVLARKDTPASYHLCVTHDDALQGVTLVTRGVDLKPATHLHRLLQALLGWPEPAYAHHALLTGPDGRRLAKRDGAPTLRACREAGRTPAELRALAGFD